MEKFYEKLEEHNLDNQIHRKDKGIFFINTSFDNRLLEFIWFDLKERILDENIKEITIYINSGGGHINVLFPIIDLINSTDKIIKTIALGRACSCACMLLLFGTKGNRFAYSHTAILLHEVSSGYNYNKNSQIQEDAKHLNRSNNIFIDIIKDKTKMIKKDILKYMDSNKDMYITSKQALKFGIIDKIL